VSGSAGPVDLRSDTVTRPGPGMREAMARAEVGDDVYGEDPTVRRLEELGAALLGHEAALFVPTGTMGNQIAIHLLSRPGSDVLVEDGSHVYRYELGAMAAWSGASPRVMRGEQGLLRPEHIDAALPDDDYYRASTGMIVLENTHNHAGGIVLEPSAQEALLGAPVGSLLAGSAALVREARIVRKRMGGGMRQAGVLAAAGEYALTHHLERLALDHARASRLARAVSTNPLFALDPARVRTNILIADLRDSARTVEIVRALSRTGVLAGTMGPGRIRFVTHLDVDDAGLERAIEALDALAMS